MGFLSGILQPALALAQTPPPPSEVDTGDQAGGVAPRLDLELGVHFAWGFADPCRRVSEVERRCDGMVPILGGQLLVELRPWNHVAFGPVLAYDRGLEGHTLSLGADRYDYSRHLWRLMLELRWYSKRVRQGGLFVALRGGVAWMTDTFSPVSGSAVDTGATQTAPLFGLGFGGAFLPYRGIGATLALQAFATPFSSDAPIVPGTQGNQVYAYKIMGFVGITLSLSVGTGL